MRPVTAAILLLYGCAPSMAQTPPQLWRGTLRCDIFSGASIPLEQSIEVVVTDGIARYQRSVLRPNSSIPTEVQETAQGRVAADGSVTLTGSAQSAFYRYTSTFQGRLPPGGGPARLTGAQVWNGQRFNGEVRPCTITLQR